MNNEDWCELLSTIKVKDNRKRAATQIKIIETSIEGSHYNSDECIRALCNKRARNCVLCKKQGENIKHHGVHHYCVLCNKSGMSERSIFFIELKTILEKVQTRSLSKMDLEDPLELGSML